MSGHLVQGQKLMLPVNAHDPNNKQRLLDMNQITENGSVQLLGSSGRDFQDQVYRKKENKNTNK